MRRRIELARTFIAKEFADPTQEPRGDWISPDAKPAHDALCLCLDALSVAQSSDGGVEGHALSATLAPQASAVADVVVHPAGIESGPSDPVEAALSAVVAFVGKQEPDKLPDDLLYGMLGIETMCRHALAGRSRPVAQGSGDCGVPATKFSPGDPVEVRKIDNAIDEIVIRRGDVHIEQMSADGWFMGVNGCDGSYWQFWFGAKNRKSHVEFRHTETITAEEEARRTSELSSTEGK
jgi:hypothetical protein